MDQLTWYDGAWHEGNPRLFGALDHVFFMASMVFDGARSFDGAAPDLDAHCARVIQSAGKMLLQPTIEADRITEICIDGIRKFPAHTALYIRPSIFARDGFVLPDPASTDFVLTLNAMPMPEPRGMAVCFSRYTRPARDAAPTDAKAGCLYPNLQRALKEANAQGFDNAITFDPNGNVAELCTANIWIAKDGIARTPAANGTFLAGITRNRVMALLRAAGITAEEAILTREDVLGADEVFTTGNYGKVMPITRVEDRRLQPGPVYARAREAYLDFAAGSRVR